MQLQICYRIVFACTLIVCVYGKSWAAEDSGYAGSESCANCHNSEYDLWSQSDHFKAMELASSSTVMGDFSDAVVQFHGATSRFFIKGESFRVEITETDSVPEEFEIKYTFGHYPLQQYLVELEGGFLQALNVAWDSRIEQQGGQRWFHLQPDEDITPEHPFHWKNHFQNWNARCADCHSTNLIKNYDAGKHTYSTSWSEINVACESCHGPGAKHIEVVNNDAYSNLNTGFGSAAPEKMSWAFTNNDPIAKPQGKQSDHHINMCGACHSLRNQLSPKNCGKSYHDENRIQLINPVSYFDDGQIREETYVLGSFMQSKMYEQGVTCSNCHNPHSGKILVEGNGLCAQCHQPAVYDSADHHHHDSSSEGAQCVNCHMPERTYMQVDDRRDHSFTIPRPGLSLDLDVPNACTQCHIGRNDNWAISAMEGWDAASSGNHWAYLSRAAAEGDVLVTRPLTDLLKENKLPAMVQASLLNQLSSMPSRVSVETASQLLSDKSPLTRRAAVSALQNLPMELRWQLLSPYLNDASRSVRFEIAENLLIGYTELFPEQQKQLEPLIAEYREMLKVSADFPATQVAIGNLELNLRNLVAAEKAYLQALRIEPVLVPALINLSDFYRSINREEDALPLLKRAVAIAPDSGAANHSYGLYLVRQQKYGESLEYLKAAVNTEDAQPRFAYVYAIALESVGEMGEAISVLTLANSRWPNQYELLLTLVSFMDQQGAGNEIYQYISDLTRIAPSSPEVKALVQKYSGQ